MNFTKAICAFSFAAMTLTAQQKARNVIIFLGDAGGIPVLNAASIQGYQQPRKLFVQNMANIALSETSSADSWVTDSAAGMTAIVTGVKTNNGMLSQMPVADPALEGAPLKTILEYAEEHGLSTGVVSNSPMWDATPAACYAHANSRKKTGEIFQQVWKPRFGDGVDVVIGPGQKAITESLRELGLDLRTSLSAAGLPLFNSLAEVPKGARRTVVLWDGSDFNLGEAADKAIEILSQNPKGFFLMVECDLHTDNPNRGVERAVTFDRYIGKVTQRLSSDTLVLFTADHSFDFRVRSGKNGKSLTLPEAARKKTDVVAQPETNVRVDGGHTGEEVLLAAQGPGSHRVHGVMANTDVFEVMLSAFGWKPAAVATR
jgi:alkaline phosphatase